MAEGQGCTPANHQVHNKDKEMIMPTHEKHMKAMPKQMPAKMPEYATHKMPGGKTMPGMKHPAPKGKGK